MGYFEWLQTVPANIGNSRRCTGKPQHEFNLIYGLHQETRTGLRTAAQVHAIKRIGETMEPKGTSSYFSRVDAS